MYAVKLKLVCNLKEFASFMKRKFDSWRGNIKHKGRQVSLHESAKLSDPAVATWAPVVLKCRTFIQKNQWCAHKLNIDVDKDDLVEEPTIDRRKKRKTERDAPRAPEQPTGNNAKSPSHKSVAEPARRSTSTGTRTHKQWHLFDCPGA